MKLAPASGLFLGMGSFALPISAQESVEGEEIKSAKKSTQSYFKNEMPSFGAMGANHGRGPTLSLC